MFAMDINSQILLYAFLLTCVLGIVANKTNFCTMGAVFDMVNIGDSNRLRAWFLAIAVAVIGVGVLNGYALDISLTGSAETAKPPYTAPLFIWPRYVLGGLLFGIGMTLASGCGNKTLVRVGGGNLKSIVVLFTMGVAAYLMIYADMGAWLFLDWMKVVAIDFLDYGLPNQSLVAVLSLVMDPELLSHAKVALTLGGVLLIWIFSSKGFRTQYDDIVGGLVVGVVIVLGWVLTAGYLGQEVFEEIEFMSPRPYDVGAQSLTFVKPTAQMIYWLQHGFAFNFLTFSLVSAFGVIVGSAIYAGASRQFRFEWFYSFSDFMRHFIGAILMGVGGALSLGCTFGQAITGASTLALGSFVTMAFIIVGAASTMKAQYMFLMRQ